MALVKNCSDAMVWANCVVGIEGALARNVGGHGWPETSHTDVLGAVSG